MLAPDSYPHVTCGCAVRGQRAGRRLGLAAAKFHRRHDRRPGLIVASAGRDFGPRLRAACSPPGSPGIAAPWASLANPAAPPSPARYHRSAVTQYCSITVFTADIGGRVRRPGHRPRDVRFVRRMRAPARVPRLPSRRPTSDSTVQVPRTSSRPRARATAAIRAWMVLCNRRIEPWCQRSPLPDLCGNQPAT